MAITYSLAPNPKWYIADLAGLPLAGGYMATFRALDPSQIKLVFEDPSGNFPFPYVQIPNVGSLGILFDENGSQGPFYWAFDSANPDDSYYIEIYDFNGNLQWTIDDFPSQSGSGGSIVTTAVNLQNLITNSVFWRNIGSSANPIGTTLLKIAPGAHAGLAATSSNAGPDILFLKNNTSATDVLQFLNFTLGSTPFAGDVTPVQYLNYTCTGAGTSETQKCVQIPITRNVQNLTNQSVTVTIWARVNSGNNSLLLQWRQFFGDGGTPTADQIIPIQTLTLSSSWQKFSITTVVPSVLASPPNVLGDCGNDALFLQIQFPLGATTNQDLVLPSLYLGSLSPDNDYVTYDMIDGVINAPRTGYIFSGYDTVAPPGYVYMNDGTIGSASSGATSRANIDTFPLYNLLYTNVTIPSGNTLCNVTGYTGNPIVDFSANRSMSIPRALGRVFSGSGLGATLTNHALGFFNGEETHPLTIPEMPSHTHPGSTVPFSNVAASRGSSGSDTVIAPGPGSVTVAAQGGGVVGVGPGNAHNTIQPTSYANHFIKL